MLEKMSINIIYLKIRSYNNIRNICDHFRSYLNFANFRCCSKKPAIRRFELKLHKMCRECN